MKWLLSLLAVCTALSGIAQNNLTYAEWFMDQDPGLGSGNALPTTGSTDTISWAVDLSQMDPGVHFLFARIQDETGKWSTTQVRSFLVLPPNALPADKSLVRAEWFLDADPGLGNGTPLSAGGDRDTLNWAIDLSSTDPGLHYLLVRAQDSEGVWSTTQVRSFLVLPPNALPSQKSLSRAEWFLDKDPGFGNGNGLSVSGERDSLNWMIDLSGLEPGVHFLFVRLQDSEGVWSTTYVRSFLVVPTGEDPIEAIDYRILGSTDTTTLSYQLEEPANQVAVEFDLLVDTLMGGDYRVCFSARTIEGFSSGERCYDFSVETPVNLLSPDHSLSLEIYPNPATDRITLEWSGNLELRSVTLFAPDGRPVMRQSLRAFSGRQQLELADLPHGVYTLVAEAKGVVSIKRLLVH